LVSLRIGNLDYRSSELAAKTKTGLNFSGRELRIQGRLCRIARLDGDDFKFLDDPESVPSELPTAGLRVGLFSFLQGLPETSAKYSYPVKWDNLAVLRVSTYEHRWTEKFGLKMRKQANRAEKRQLCSLKLHSKMNSMIALGAFDYIVVER
jgi:hypothetical protein